MAFRALLKRADETVDCELASRRGCCVSGSSGALGSLLPAWVKPRTEVLRRQSMEGIPMTRRLTLIALGLMILLACPLSASAQAVSEAEAQEFQRIIAGQLDAFS